MKVGIKIGSVLLTKDGKLNTKLIYKIADQINLLIEREHRVFLVSSGDIASCPADVSSPKNLQAALGQGFLISHYIQIFSVFGMQAAQILVTDRDLNKAGKELSQLFDQIYIHNLRSCNKIVPIINANNAVDWKEIDQINDCSDNDNLFCQVALLFNADIAIIGFDGPCVVNEDPTNSEDEEHPDVINEKNYGRLFTYIHEQCKNAESRLARGGIVTKMIAGKTLAEHKIKTILADGNQEEFIAKAIHDLMAVYDSNEPTYKVGSTFIFPEPEIRLPEFT